MPTPLSGHLETRLLADGRRAFYAKIRTDRHALGREPEWTKARAERFLNATLLPAAKLRQRWWGPDPCARCGSRADAVSDGLARVHRVGGVA